MKRRAPTARSTSASPPRWSRCGWERMTPNPAAPRRPRRPCAPALRARLGRPAVDEDPLAGGGADERRVPLADVEEADLELPLRRASRAPRARRAQPGGDQRWRARAGEGLVLGGIVAGSGGEGARGAGSALSGGGLCATSPVPWQRVTASPRRWMRLPTAFAGESRPLGSGGSGPVHAVSRARARHAGALHGGIRPGRRRRGLRPQLRGVRQRRQLRHRAGGAGGRRPRSLRRASGPRRTSPPTSITPCSSRTPRATTW